MATKYSIPEPQPARNYVEAGQRITEWQSQEPADVAPESCSVFLTHDHPTERVIVLLHGFTNSPRQFVQLGQQLHAQGHNVIIPRAPHHGLQDRMTTALAGLTGDELLGYLWRACDLSQGLGEQVTVVGFSMGGVLAGWAAQLRNDVERVMLVAPAMGFRALPKLLTPAVRQMALALPNQFQWWDPATRDAPVPPLHAYPRYSTRALAHILSLAHELQRAARLNQPQARRVQVVTNPSDEAVDNQAVQALVEAWQKAGAQNITTYTFELQLGLIHDLIDPTQTRQQVGQVYPILLDLLR